MKELPGYCPACGNREPWQTGKSQLGRLGHKVTIWAECTECKVCGFHFMTDEQVEQADEELVAIENTYCKRYES